MIIFIIAPSKRLYDDDDRRHCRVPPRPSRHSGHHQSFGHLDKKSSQQRKMVMIGRQIEHAAATAAAAGWVTLLQLPARLRMAQAPSAEHHDDAPLCRTKLFLGLNFPSLIMVDLTANLEGPIQSSLPPPPRRFSYYFNILASLFLHNPLYYHQSVGGCRPEVVESDIDFPIV